MIFITVGNLDPFDRLIRAVDAWIAEQSQPVEVLAQIGTGQYRPANCKSVDFLSPHEYREAFSQAKLIVSHAGMGTIITALEYNKPIIIMPKRASLGEQRNEHQLATARRFRRSEHLQVAEDVEQLRAALDAFRMHPIEPSTLEKRVWQADVTLVDFVRDFVSPPAVPHASPPAPAEKPRPTSRPATRPSTVS